MKVSSSILVTVSVLAATIAGGTSQVKADTWRARSVSEVKQSINMVGFNNYVIQRGDTLWTIGQATGVSVQQLMNIYHTENPNLIIAGTHLVFNGDHMTIVSAAGQNEGTYDVTPATPTTATIQSQYTLKNSNNPSSTENYSTQATQGPQQAAVQASSTQQTPMTPATKASVPQVSNAPVTQQNGSTQAPQSTTTNSTSTSTPVQVPSQSTPETSTTNQQPEKQVSFSSNYYLLQGDEINKDSIYQSFHETQQATAGQQVTVQPRVDSDGWNYPGYPFSLMSSDGPEGKVGMGTDSSQQSAYLNSIDKNAASVPDKTTGDMENNPQTSNFNQTFTANDSGQQVNFYYHVNANK